MTQPESPNPGQIAPGAEAGEIPFNAPYVGWSPSEHVGYPLTDSFGIGIEHGRA